MKKTLIIIPAYNEEDSIIGVIRSLRAACPDVDYLVINDCSTDHTRDLLRQEKAVYLDLPVNLGIGGAVQSGYIYAREHGYDIAIQLDGDGQHDPKYIPDLIRAISRGGADIAVGSRFINGEGFQSSAARRAGIKFLHGLIKLTSGVSVLDATSGFRAVNQRGIELYAGDYAQDYPEPEAIVTGASAGLKIVEVPVIMSEREGGSSSIHGIRSLYYMIKVSSAILISRITHPRRKVDL